MGNNASSNDKQKNQILSEYNNENKTRSQTTAANINVNDIVRIINKKANSPNTITVTHPPEDKVVSSKKPDNKAPNSNLLNLPNGNQLAKSVIVSEGRSHGSTVSFKRNDSAINFSQVNNDGSKGEVISHQEFQEKINLANSQLDQSKSGQSQNQEHEASGKVNKIKFVKKKLKIEKGTEQYNELKQKKLNENEMKIKVMQKLAEENNMKINLQEGLCKQMYNEEDNNTQQPKRKKSESLKDLDFGKEKAQHKKTNLIKVAKSHAGGKKTQAPIESTSIAFSSNFVTQQSIYSDASSQNSQVYKLKRSSEKGFKIVPAKENKKISIPIPVAPKKKSSRGIIKNTDVSPRIINIESDEVFKDRNKHNTTPNSHVDFIIKDNVSNHAMNNSVFNHNHISTPRHKKNFTINSHNHNKQESESGSLINEIILQCKSDVYENKEKRFKIRESKPKVNNLISGSDSKSLARFEKDLSLFEDTDNIDSVDSFKRVKMCKASDQKSKSNFSPEHRAYKAKEPNIIRARTIASQANNSNDSEINNRLRSSRILEDKTQIVIHTPNKEKANSCVNIDTNEKKKSDKVKRLDLGQDVQLSRKSSRMSVQSKKSSHTHREVDILNKIDKEEVIIKNPRSKQSNNTSVSKKGNFFDVNEESDKCHNNTVDVKLSMADSQIQLKRNTVTPPTPPPAKVKQRKVDLKSKTSLPNIDIDEAIQKGSLKQSRTSFGSNNKNLQQKHNSLENNEIKDYNISPIIDKEMSNIGMNSNQQSSNNKLKIRGSIAKGSVNIHDIDVICGIDKGNT